MAFLIFLQLSETFGIREISSQAAVAHRESSGDQSMQFQTLWNVKRVK